MRGMRLGLFHAEYVRYRQECTEECDTLEEAESYLRWLEDYGEGVGMRITGPNYAKEWCS
jgi:hypothetical protein